MKTLVTAATIKEHFAKNEQTLYIEPNSIVTPAARDAAADLKIKIVVDAAPASEPDSGGAEPKIVLDQDLIARIVAEVTARINFQQSSALIKEADPGGLRLVRGNSVVLEDCPGANSIGRIKTKEVIGVKESPMTAGFMTIEAGSFRNSPKYDEICYILQGSLTCDVGGKRYVGNKGDTLFIPAYGHITCSAEETAKVFFVACPSGSR